MKNVFFTIGIKRVYSIWQINILVLCLFRFDVTEFSWKWDPHSFVLLSPKLGGVVKKHNKLKKKAKTFFLLTFVYVFNVQGFLFG